jgi:hypothetical protein
MERTIVHYQKRNGKSLCAIKALKEMIGNRKKRKEKKEKNTSE